jgi:hypothetical protein
MKKVLLVIIGILIGFIFSLVISGKTLKAEEPDLEERVSTVRHGYGVYLKFEYEIVDSSYGSFVVVRHRNGNSYSDLHVAGIKP